METRGSTGERQPTDLQHPSVLDPTTNCLHALFSVLLQNTFEFKPVGGQNQAVQHQQPSSKVFPFTAALRQPSAAAAGGGSTRIMDAYMQSPEPATPASITSESRGGPAGPPLTTLASLSKMSPSDSDTVTPLANMHASHVPLSTYAGSPDDVVAAKKCAGGKFVWQAILMWQEPMQTATVFIAGLTAFGLLNFAAYGAHKMTLMSGRAVCVCVLPMQRGLHQQTHQQACRRVSLLRQHHVMRVAATR